MRLNEIKVENNVEQIKKYNNCVEKVNNIIAEEVNKYNKRIEELQNKNEKGEENEQ